MAQMCHIHRIPLHSSLPLFQLEVLHIPPSLYTTECKDSRSPSQVLLAEVLHYNHHHLLIENKDRVKKCSRKKPVDKHVQWWSYTPRCIYIFFISFFTGELEIEGRCKQCDILSDHKISGTGGRTVWRQGLHLLGMGG